MVDGVARKFSDGQSPRTRVVGQYSNSTRRRNISAAYKSSWSEHSRIEPLSWRTSTFLRPIKERVGYLLALVVFIVILSQIVLYKVIYFYHAEGFSLWYIYSFLAGIFLVSRLPLSFVHDDADIHSHGIDKDYSYPDISIVIAAKNEEESIYKTIQACMDSEYPGNIECIAVDDGSTDATFPEMERASRDWGGATRESYFSWCQQGKTRSYV